MFFKGKTVLVIGGTGTIGRRIVQTIMEDEPELIRIYSRDEFKQYQFLNEYEHKGHLQAIIGDVRDYERVYQAMQDVDYVFHLAAMKQVAACEFNPYEAVKTNVNGTENVIHAAIAQKVKKVVFTSSDKAISPTNTYGATKLIGERLLAAADINRAGTVFASVRFGNVMGSRGSVIPLFKKQITSQKKITITDYKMTRFMMTLHQATSLTIQALKEAQGGEVFVLKMPVVRLDILGKIIMESTCEKLGIKEEDIRIEEVGIRPGEKMYEELMTYDESLNAWELPDMYVIPGPNRKTKSYKKARKSKPGTYGSMDQQAVSYAELKQLLQESDLI